jgi:hypothetical protein
VRPGSLASTVCLALPGAKLGGIPASVGAVTSRADEDTRRALEEGESAGPWRLAGTATWDDIVHPAELRDVLLRHLALAGPRRRRQPEPVVRAGYLP